MAPTGVSASGCITRPPCRTHDNRERIVTLHPLLAVGLGGLSAVPAAFLAIAALIFVHEFGHFIVAKAVGVGVTTFSLGFGRRVWGFTYKGTDYRISAIPFGGYVALTGADPFSYEENPEDQPNNPDEAFLSKPVWQRLLVIAAGPAMNLVLPVFVFTALLMAGEPRPAAEVGELSPDGLAAQAGLLPGDRITAVDDAQVRTFSELADALVELSPGAHAVSVDRAGAPTTLTLTVPPEGIEGVAIGLSSRRPSAMVGVDDPASPAGQAGLETGSLITAVNGEEVRDWLALSDALASAGPSVTVSFLPPREGATEEQRTLTQVAGWAPVADSPSEPVATTWGLAPASLFIGKVAATVMPDDGGLIGPTSEPPPSPAMAAGLLPGDRFLAIDGEPVRLWSDVLELVSASLPTGDDVTQADVRPVSIDVLRAGQVISLTMTPQIIQDTDELARKRTRPVIGIERLGTYVSAPDVRVFYRFVPAVKRASAETYMSARFILNHLGGMVTSEVAVKESVGGPLEIFRQTHKAAQRGLFDYARLVAGISISLGIVNLLPVPVLDGGTLLFFTIEAIRGRPVSVTFRERAQQIGFLVLVLFMATVLVWDFQRGWVDLMTWLGSG